MSLGAKYDWLLFDADNTIWDFDAAEAHALERTLVELRREHSIGRSEIHGHQHFKATECPGPALMTWTRRYRSLHPQTPRSPRNQRATHTRRTMLPSIRPLKRGRAISIVQTAKTWGRTRCV